MALINCPECGKEISTTAEVCVNCGYDLLVHRESLRIDEEIERDLREYERQIRKPTQITSLSEVYRYRNEETAGKIILIAAIGMFIWGLGLLITAPPISIIAFLVSIIVLFLYIKSKSHSRQLLKEEQARIQKEIDNFEIIKKRKVDSHREYLLRQKNQKLEKIKARNSIPQSGNTIVARCPMCGGTTFEKISTFDRAVSVGLVGVASGKIGKQYKCKRCGHMW